MDIGRDSPLLSKVGEVFEKHKEPFDLLDNLFRLNIELRRKDKDYRIASAGEGSQDERFAVAILLQTFKLVKIDESCSYGELLAIEEYHKNITRLFRDYIENPQQKLFYDLYNATNKVVS